MSAHINFDLISDKLDCVVPSTSVPPTFWNSQDSSPKKIKHERQQSSVRLYDISLERIDEGKLDIRLIFQHFRL